MLVNASYSAMSLTVQISILTVHLCLQLERMEMLDKVPPNLLPGCTAVRCVLRTTSGAATAVVLGGRPHILADQKLMQHAVRMTLVADSVSLQFRLPPPGMAMPLPRSSAAVAWGAPVVDTLVLTSVWAVGVLRQLCQRQVCPESCNPEQTHC